VIDQDEQIVKQRLDFVIRAIARQLFSDADKARKDMEAFAAANEQRLYKLFKACADPQTDLRTLVKSRVSLDVALSGLKLKRTERAPSPARAVSHRHPRDLHDHN
jgi:hypothetical protein